jgi:hypothetical protein
MATWNEAIEQFSRVTDTLGKPIDTDIFEAVVALNLSGIITRQSCEGHLNWGLPYPWIEIQPELAQKYALHQLLSRFYEGRTIDFDRLLIFHGYRLRSAGAAFSTLLSPEEQEYKLHVYQAEMAAFTSFLKSLFPEILAKQQKAPGQA